MRYFRREMHRFTRVRAQVRRQGPMAATTEKGAPVSASGSRVPYYEVVEGYSKAAEEALAREEVPPAYRGTVREYFRSLQGGSDEKAPQEKGSGGK